MASVEYVHVLRLFLLLAGCFLPSDQCYFSTPEDRVECVFSCINTITEEHFQSLPDNMTNCKTVSYYLSKGNFTYFAPNYFSNLGHMNHFFGELQDTIFDYFPSKPGEGSPFVNVTFDTSAILYIIRVKVTQSWNWGALSEMIPLKGGSGSIEAYTIDMTHLSRDFNQVFRGAVRSVRFGGGNLQTLDDDVFSSFSLLESVMLHSNEITTMKRNYFPNPANLLTVLNLHSNKLKSLPIDMFLNMPTLREVVLTNNEFTTLDEVVFRPIAGKVELGYGSIISHCDCSIRWLKYVTGPFADELRSQTTCRTPLALEGKSLENVTEEELGCDMDE